MYLQALPPPIIHIALESPGNQALDAAVEPDLSEQSIVALLVEEELVVAAQGGVDFAVLVEVRRHVPCAVVEVEEENHALADVDEKTDLAAASVGRCLLVILFFFSLSRRFVKGGK